MDFGSAFTYPTRDPEWIKKALLGGVLSMIPIANFIPVGHMLAVAEEVSQGADQQLPPWDQLGGYFKKGFGVAVISIVIMLPVILLLVCGYGLGLGLITATGGDVDEGTLNIVLIAVQCVVFVLALISALFLPAALSEYVVTGRVGAAINPSAVLAEFRARAGQYVVLGLLAVFGAWLAALLGMIACGLGVFLTVPYFNFVYGNLLGQLVAARRGR
ncbi:MAG: DUF4013 domain-containing protein [Anaerolineales bacterium]|nr:DUF4013 domain-containing protein [Anaerolineales bacterium]